MKLKRLSKSKMRLPHLRSERGQMAIFVALIFQVLFIFFAMAINVGMVVHDKINLQNAVDLAAYYAAQRQAEWLNVIAHQNYQIRQSFKLFAWRYRVLGTIARSEHPIRVEPAPNNGERIYPDAFQPELCVTSVENFLGLDGKKDSDGGDNICKGKNIAVSPIRMTPGFGIINIGLNIFTREINKKITATCKNYGGLNYFYLNGIRYAYQVDQYRIKNVILKLAENLARPMNEMIDLDGATVYAGAQKTFLKNLTYENRMGGPVFTLSNSIEGRAPTDWLNEIRIAVHMFYRDIQNKSGCFSQTVDSYTMPAKSDAYKYLSEQTGMSVEDMMAYFATPEPSSLMRLSLGFEKNPWLRLYVRARAQSRPRQIFFPFGQPIVMTATAYAAPFGGVIGPPYKVRWKPGESQSDSSEQTDPLVPPLVKAGTGALIGEPDNRLLPNYSRFPGDKLGLTAVSAQAVSLGRGIKASFRSLLQSMETGPNVVPDPLSWQPDEPITIRRYEIMAAAPDLFDVTYYSIEPSWGKTYYPKLMRLRNALGIPQDIKPRPDLGGREDVEDLKAFSVKDQIAIVHGRAPYQYSTISNNQTIDLSAPWRFWVIKDRAHLLTGWVPNYEIAKYGRDQFPKDRFGKCDPDMWDDNYKVIVPGSCLAGGRTGYSVKLISGDFLRQPYRNAGEIGVILNPPDTLK